MTGGLSWWLLVGWLAAGAPALLTWLWLAAVPATPTARHRAWSIAVLAPLLAAPLAALLPDWQLAVLPAAPSAAPTAAAAAPAQTDAATVAATAAGLAWLAGTLWLLLELLAQTRAWAGRARRATPIEACTWREPMDALRRRLGVPMPVALRRSEELDVPVLWGLRAPTILLPRDCATWSRARRQAVLAHELAHARRHDCAVGLALRAARAVLWVQPLVWFAARRAQLEQELACDAEVLDAGGRATRYAAALVDFARERIRQPRCSAAPAVSGAVAELTGRVHRILDGPHGGRRRAARLLWVVHAAVAAVALLPLCNLRLTRALAAEASLPHQAATQRPSDPAESNRPARRANAGPLRPVAATEHARTATPGQQTPRHASGVPRARPTTQAPSAALPIATPALTHPAGEATDPASSADESRLAAPTAPASLASAATKSPDAASAAAPMLATPSDPTVTPFPTVLPAAPPTPLPAALPTVSYAATPTPAGSKVGFHLVGPVVVPQGRDPEEYAVEIALGILQRELGNLRR